MNVQKFAIRSALVLAVLALCACASTDARYEQAQANARASLDYEKIALVNHMARRKGVEVHWVNPPHLVDQD